MYSYHVADWKREKSQVYSCGRAAGLFLFVIVHSSYRPCGGGDDTLRAPAMDHHLCSCGRNFTAGNNHSNPLEGESADHWALSGFLSVQLLHIKPAVASGRGDSFDSATMTEPRWAFSLTPVHPSLPSSSSSSPSVASFRGPTGGRCMRPRPRRLRWRFSPLRQRG